MKKYFAKYLPVGGEIKPGDRAFSGLLGTILSIYEVNDFWKTHEGVMPERIKGWEKSGAFKKAELFLCSSTKSGYKVIGSISTDAVWIKEGDEFNEKDLAFRFKPDSSFSDFPFYQEFTSVVNFKPGIELCIKGLSTIGVRCQTCKTFH